ncbi:hypothetical protein V8G54_005078 [Vigna mungo]|uniref:glycerophosphodiester phosphodiesterase n=1 Tax=Vigna mungo TaxID=3915 RepID=A0AAQ3PHW2_VIGMU
MALCNRVRSGISSSINQPPSLPIVPIFNDLSLPLPFPSGRIINPTTSRNYANVPGEKDKKVKEIPLGSQKNLLFEHVFSQCWFLWPCMEVQETMSLLCTLHLSNAIEKVESELLQFVEAVKNSSIFSQFIKELFVAKDVRVKVIHSYPPCIDLAYEKAVSDGVDVLDCLVQMSKDGIPFCLNSTDLIGL